MPKGHVGKREAKKPKKKDPKKGLTPTLLETSPQVEVTGKRRKQKEEVE